MLLSVAGCSSGNFFDMSNSNLVGLAAFGNGVEGVAGGVIEAVEVEGWPMSCFFRFGCGPFEIVGVGGGVKVELEEKDKVFLLFDKI